MRLKRCPDGRCLRRSHVGAAGRHQRYDGAAAHTLQASGEASPAACGLQTDATSVRLPHCRLLLLVQRLLLRLQLQVLWVVLGRCMR